MRQEPNRKEIGQMPARPLPEFSGARLAAIIRQRGWSVEQFVEFLRMVSPKHSKLAPTSVYAYIKGVNEPSINLLPAFGRTLGLRNPYKELFEEPRVN